MAVCHSLKAKYAIEMISSLQIVQGCPRSGNTEALLETRRPKTLPLAATVAAPELEEASGPISRQHGLGQAMCGQDRGEGYDAGIHNHGLGQRAQQ